MGEDAAGELVGHLVERGWAEVVGGDERKDGRSGVGGAVHVADVNFVERGFADREHKRTLFFEANVGGTLDQVRGDAIGNAGERADATGEHDHRVGGIRAAGDVGTDICVGLLMNLARQRRFASENLADEVVAAFEAKFFGHDAQRAVGCDEVDGLNAVVAINGEQEMAQEDCTACAGGDDGQIVRRVGQEIYGSRASQTEARDIFNSADEVRA